MKNKSKGKDLYVTDISFDAVEEDLHKLFSVCGSVRAINMMTDPSSGQFKGRAFVRMATDAQAKEAVNMLDGTRLVGRCITVTAARQKPVPEPEAEVVEKKPRRRREPKGRRRS